MNARAPLLSRWLAAAFTVVFASSVAAVLFASGIGVGPRVEPILATALSVAAYGAVALGGFRRVSLEDRVSWLVAVMAAHATLGLLAAWLFGFIGALRLDAALGQAFGGFVPAAVVSLIAAPVAALPFRPSAPRPRGPRGTRDAWSASRGHDPDRRVTPGAAPARSRSPVSSVAAAMPPVLPDRPAGTDASGHTRGRVLRITFARVADQLPLDMLALPPARLAATLLAPGEMLVPIGLVLPRLHEGAVAVPATVLDDQLPRGAVLLSSPEACARWRALSLALPMDEVRAQLPTDVPPPETSVAGVDTVELSTATRGPSTQPPTVTPRMPPRRLRADEIAAAVTLLAPVGRFATQSRDVDGLGHLLLLTHDLPGDAIEVVVRALVRVLPPASGSPALATIVTEGAAVTVAAGAGVAIAVAAPQPGAPVALMELLVGRAAATIALGPPTAPAFLPCRLREVSVVDASDLEAIGATLTGFGGVAPAVLHEEDRGLELYVFRPRGTPPAALGGLVAALDAALAESELGRLAALSVRAAGFRTEVRWAAKRAAVVAVSGIVTQPGLARRQAMRAAAALEGPVCP